MLSQRDWQSINLIFVETDIRSKIFFSATLVKFTLFQSFQGEIISLLTSALTSSRQELVRSSASALFNILRILILDSSIFLEENELLCIASGINKAVDMLLQAGSGNDGLLKLLISCFDGIIIVARRSLVSETFEDFLVLEAPEILSKISTAESREVLLLLTKD